MSVSMNSSYSGSSTSSNTGDLTEVNSNMPYPWQIKYDATLAQYYYYNERDDTVSFDSPCEVQTHFEKISSSGKARFFSKFKKTVRANQDFCPFSTKSLPEKVLPKKGKMLTRITTALSMKSSSSKSETNTPPASTAISYTEHAPASPSSLFETKTHRRSLTPPTTSYFNAPITPSHTNDAFLVVNFNDFKNFSGTSMVDRRPKHRSQVNSWSNDVEFDDSESIESMEEASFYSDLEDYSSSEEESIRSYHLDESHYTLKLAQPYAYNDYHYSYTPEEELSDRQLTDAKADKEGERQQLRLQMLKELDF